MAAFLVFLEVEIDADTHEEAARIFQGALPEYSILDGLTYYVTGYATDDSKHATTEHIELLGRESPTVVLDAMAARQNATDAVVV